MTLESLRLRIETVVTLAVYLSLGSALVLTISLYQGTDASLLDTASTSWLLLAAASGAGLIVGIAVLAIAWWASRDARRRKFALPATLSLIFGLGILAILEIGFRTIAVPDPLGQRVGSTVLLPYEWEVLVDFNKQLLEQARSPSAFYVEDDRLGWSVGESRSSEDGLYHSSVESLRSEEPGISLREQGSGRRRIALLGDSFVFSEEVGYPDSLSRHLEDVLASSFQVINFGVPGYGVDQAVLRFENDAISWEPEVAILGIIQDDLFRTVNVYTFLKLGWGLPMSKPRFVGRDGTLDLRNWPTADPEEILASTDIADLPLLDFEIEYFARQWRRHLLHGFYLFRYAVSRVPVWPTENPNTSEEAIIDLGSLIVRRFWARATEAGIVPLVVFLPSRSAFAGVDHSVAYRLIDTLGDEGIAVQDATDCLLSAVSESDDLFVTEGVHYSGTGNGALANCLAGWVSAAIGDAAR